MNTEDHIVDMAKEAVGNWRKFQSFAWHDEPDDGENWTIVYTHNRDSTLLELSNAEAIKEAMAPHCAEDDSDAREESHNHWAVGHVDGYAIRVYRDGQVTEAFKEWAKLQLRLADYPVLDDDDYSTREYEATLENIGNVGRRFLIDDVPDRWEGEVFSWFWENNQSEVESSDDQGGYPSDDAMKEALGALGWLDTED